jgi:putative ABC transport system permease protein
MSQTSRPALRAIATHRGFSLVVVLTMALCIGANVAIFSGARAVLFRPLPYPYAERMVIMDVFDPTAHGEVDLSWIDAVDWGKRSRLIQKVCPFLCWQDRLIVHRDSVERINVNFVPSAYFDLLGAKPQLGRVLSADMDGAPGTSPVVVLTDYRWRKSFGADPAIIGKKVQLNSRAYTVLGVMPHGFWDFTLAHIPCDAWIPANMAGDAFPAGVQLFSRDENDWFGAAVLAPGVSLERARKEADAIGAQLRREFPDTDKNYYPRLTPLRQWLFGDLVPGMRALLLVGVLVLLIGCANVATLFLAQVARRRAEIAAQLAGGATRAQLARQVLAQSVILSLAGGALGMLFAAWGARRLATLLDLAVYTRVEINGQVLGVALLVTVAAGLLCGLPAALAVWRQGAATAPAAAARPAGSWAFSAWLVFDVALVLAPIIAGGLLVRSFWLLEKRSVGYDTANLLSLHMSYKSEEYKDLTKVSAALAGIMRRVDALPGVVGSAVWGPEVPGTLTQFTEMLRDGQPATAPVTRAELHLISPGSLALLHLPVLRGREFGPEDTRDKPRVALVSDGLAKALWPGQDPIGKRLYRPERENGARVVVVGVIPDVMLQGRFIEGSRHILFPSSQIPPIDGYLLVRSRGDARALEGAVVDAVRQVDSQIPVFDARTVADRLHQQEKAHRLNAAIVGTSALLAAVLAIIGVYGTLLYALLRQLDGLGQAASEAERQAAARRVLARGAVLVTAGVVLGLIAALAWTRLLGTLLYGVTATDPATFAGAAAILAAVLLATLPLVGRAARTALADGHGGQLSPTAVHEH